MGIANTQLEHVRFWIINTFTLNLTLNNCKCSLIIRHDQRARLEISRYSESSVLDEHGKKGCNVLTVNDVRFMP